MTDSAGNLYVNCLCYGSISSPYYALFVLEFNPQANGDVAPIRILHDPLKNEMYWDDNGGIAVDAAGTIYVSAATLYGDPAVFEFAPGTSGEVSASKIVKHATWTDGHRSRIAVH